ncbi:sigma-70 family RNA polymerase sigma factor [Candidatus Kaiserbacteria bacterium]|nr:sigma-70 family RNA polymerase sigma factor [Candidatus Kaiserbacteria bacterium]
MSNESPTSPAAPENEKDSLSWTNIADYIENQAEGKSEFWLPDYYELTDEKGEPILDAEQKRIMVELGIMTVGGNAVPMVRAPILPEGPKPKRGKAKKREGNIIKPVSAFGNLLHGSTIANARRVQQIHIDKTGSVADPYSIEKTTQRVALTDIEKTQRRAIAFLLDTGNTAATIGEILKTGNFGPRLGRGEIIKIIYDAKDVKNFVSENTYYDLPPVAIKTLTDLARRIQPQKKYGLRPEELGLDTRSQKAGRELLGLDIEKHDTRWNEQVLLMAAHLSAAKLPHDVTAKILGKKLQEEGRGPLTYSELGQVYTRVFYRDPYRFIQDRDANGVGLNPELQRYIDQAIQDYNEGRTAAREQQIAESIAQRLDEIGYDQDALSRLPDKDRELLLAWNDGQSTAAELTNMFGLKPGTLNLKIAALRAAGFPVREGEAMKTLIERIKIDATTDTTPNQDVYNYDPERLKDLPEPVQWLVKAWNRGEHTLYQLGTKAGISPQNMQAYFSQLRKQQYPIRMGEKIGPLAGLPTRESGEGGTRAVVRETEDLDVSMRQLLQHAVLPREEQRELVRRWQQDGDEKARDRLVRHYYRFIAKIANRYRNLGVDMADLISFGVDGLLRAIDRTDLKMNLAVSTYAAWWIRQRIVRGIQDESRTIRIPVYLQTGPRQSEDTPVSVVGIADLAAQTGRKESELDTLPALLDESMVKEQSALEAKQVTEGWKEVLNERELDIVTRRFFGEETLEEIGKNPKYNVSRERIRQIESVALEKLRAFLGVELREKTDRNVDREGTIDRFVTEIRENPNQKWQGVLNERELNILTQRFVQNKSQEDLVRAMGIAIENIRGIEGQGLGKVRRYFEFLDELNDV